MTDERFEPFFLDTAAGRLFALFKAPAYAERCVLFVPPFAEEMNKVRRQLSCADRSLSRKGIATLAIDLFGTGDSEGEFVDASWSVWKQNVASAFHWANDFGVPIDTLIANRLGCSLAVEALFDLDYSVRKTIFWQPVVSGRQYMTQFLRLRVASSMMEDDGAETVDGLRARLGEGESLEIAGYETSPQMWADVENSNLLGHLHSRLGEIVVFEIGRPRDGSLSPAGNKILKTAEQRNISVQGIRIPGEPFWTATEIVVNSQLVASTVQSIIADHDQ